MSIDPYVSFNPDKTIFWASGPTTYDGFQHHFAGAHAAAIERVIWREVDSYNFARIRRDPQEAVHVIYDIARAGVEAPEPLDWSRERLAEIASVAIEALRVLELSRERRGEAPAEPSWTGDDDR